MPRATSRMPPRVMLVGDSYAALLSASQLESLCVGSSVTNRGRSGSTAEEWAQGQLSASDWDGYTHAWLSVGANDYINSFGTVWQSEMVERTRRAIARIPPHVHVLLTGYCQVTQPLVAGMQTCTIAFQSSFMAPVAAADERVTFVDVAAACGGSASKWSPTSPRMHSDNRHLNGLGYCKLFTLPRVQAALGCGVPASGSHVCSDGSRWEAPTFNHTGRLLPETPGGLCLNPAAVWGLVIGGLLTACYAPCLVCRLQRLRRERQERRRREERERERKESSRARAETRARAKAATSTTTSACMSVAAW